MHRSRFLLQKVVAPSSILNSFVNFTVLQIYKNINGELNIAKNYIVGEESQDKMMWPGHLVGFKLGSYALLLSSLITKGEYDSATMTTLESMGFKNNEYGRHDESIISAASTFVRIYGHGAIPCTFKVPANPEWPKDTWEMAIGYVIFKMRGDEGVRSSIRGRLEDLKISLDSNALRIDCDVHLRALKTFKSINGTVNIPHMFTVPFNDERYEAQAQGLNLERWFTEICPHLDKWPEYRQQLEELGLKPSRITNVQDYAAQLRTAASSYVRLHGSSEVPMSFEVPRGSSDWPVETWGMKLGERLLNVKRSSLLADQLTQIGIVYRSFQEDDYWRAVKTFRGINGNVRIPVEYVVPNDPQFDRVAWGRRIGISFNRAKILLLAVQTYMELNSGESSVPCNFEVPYDDDKWPVETWGMKLGIVLAHMRNDENLYASVRQKLIKMGISFDKSTLTSKAEYDQYLEGLRVYKSIHGDESVPHDFVTPKDDDRYPESSRGLRLGKWLIRIKRQSKKWVEVSQQMAEINISKRDIKVTEHSTTPDSRDYAIYFKAIKVYKRLHDTAQIPVRYIVPPNDENYDECVRGMRLGKWLAHRLATLRQNPKDKGLISLGRRLQELGVVVHPEKEKKFSVQFDALKVYKSLYGCAQIPAKFVVPADDENFDIRARGMKLGQWLADRRVYLREHPDDEESSSLSQQLEDLGVQLNIRKRS